MLHAPNGILYKLHSPVEYFLDALGVSVNQVFSHFFPDCVEGAILGPFKCGLVAALSHRANLQIKCWLKKLETRRKDYSDT